MKRSLPAPPIQTSGATLGTKVSVKAVACKKDKTGRFKVKVVVVGETGKARSARVYGKRYRQSETGKCITEMLKAHQYPQFKRKTQSLTFRFKVK